MNTITGKGASGGIAIGRLKELGKEKRVIKKGKAEDAKAELRRFEAARETASCELREIYEKAVREVGKENAAIFEGQRMMLCDVDYLDFVWNMIEEKSVNAEYAVALARDDFAAMLAKLSDPYMKERAADVRDVSERLLRILAQGEGKEGEEIEKDKDLEAPYIILADDLTPSDTMQLNRNRVLALISRKGSINSHTSVLARTMNIPSLVCAPLKKELDGRLAIVDGDSGTVILEPDEETLHLYQNRMKEEEKRKKRLLCLKGRQTVTEGGKQIRLYANISAAEDVTAVLENDAEGIGLFRSEFFYLQGSDFPTEQEQFYVYKALAEKMEGKKVVIRTLDIGADKQPPYFHLKKEKNPALGCRAIRICLKRPEILKTQLRAIYQASAYGNLAVLVPMIVSLWEVKRVKELIEEVQSELLHEAVPFGKVELGLMIETPAAVMIADELASEVDFFSIGTNDLTQYTLAIDRQNESLDLFYDSHHPAVLRMIQRVIDSAHKAGIPVGICGELAADASLTNLFLKMGIDELSVSPAMVLSIRDKIVSRQKESEEKH
ncbi:MAG: phosphoenolpyruvate--protein phosphotransferase [Clostridiales bacterium]|nr:phosphoenolpyruvate--protein phosphotransferase [Clostridiales bacterium]